jgi:hypothetical protein
MNKKGGTIVEKINSLPTKLFMLSKLKYDLTIYER